MHINISTTESPELAGARTLIPTPIIHQFLSFTNCERFSTQSLNSVKSNTTLLMDTPTDNGHAHSDGGYQLKFENSAAHPFMDWNGLLRLSISSAGCTAILTYS